MSHQLTRMAERGLITRDKGPGGVIVTLTAYGRDQVRRARPVHAAAVREHLIGPLSAGERDVLLRVARRLDGPDLDEPDQDAHERHQQPGPEAGQPTFD